MPDGRLGVHLDKAVCLCLIVSSSSLLQYMYDLLKVEKDVVRGTNAVMNVLQVGAVHPGQPGMQISFNHARFSFPSFPSRGQR